MQDQACQQQQALQEALSTARTTTLAVPRPPSTTQGATLTQRVATGAGGVHAVAPTPTTHTPSMVVRVGCTLGALAVMEAGVGVLATRHLHLQ